MPSRRVAFPILAVFGDGAVLYHDECTLTPAEWHEHRDNETEVHDARPPEPTQ